MRESGVGRVPPILKPLERTLTEWGELMSDSSWQPSTDGFPWHYNERAMLSLLVGAVWKCGGWCFEEYATNKAKGEAIRRGRCDTMLVLAKRTFVAEAKHDFLPATDMSSALCAKVLNRALHDAHELQLRPGRTRLAIVTIAPAIKTAALEAEHTALDERITWALNRFQEALAPHGRRAAMAWAFPRRARDVAVRHRKYGPQLLPGVMLGIVAPSASR